MQVIYLLGPTASGKTTLGLKLSDFFRCGLIHADKIYDSLAEYYCMNAALLLSPLCGENLPDIKNSALRNQEVPFEHAHKSIWERMLLNYKNTNTLIIEGSTPILSYEHKVINDYLSPKHSWFFYLIPENYESYFKSKFNQPFINTKLVQCYERLVKDSTLSIISLKKPEILLERMPYQRVGLTDVKFSRFDIDTLRDLDVLDIGSNTGWFCRYAYDLKCGSYTGVESAWREMIHAIRWHEQGNYIFGKLQDVWDQLKEYDVVFLCSTWHYFDNKEEIVKNISKRIRKGGYLVLETPICEDLTETEKPYTNAGKDITIPSKSLVETWLKRYYSNVFYVNASIPPDGTSCRIIYKAFK